MAETFTCYLCKKTLPKPWSDKEAIERSRKMFKGFNEYAPNEKICIECFKDFKAWAIKQGIILQ